MQASVMSAGQRSGQVEDNGAYSVQYRRTGGFALDRGSLVSFRFAKSFIQRGLLRGSSAATSSSTRCEVPR